MAAKSREDYKIALAKYKAGTSGSKVSDSKSAEMSEGSDDEENSDEGAESVSDDE